jgi:hypothetical protein
MIWRSPFAVASTVTGAEDKMEHDDLHSLELLLREGMRLDKQTSYQRRQPAGPAIEPLTRARQGLARFVSSSPGNAKAWHLLSLAEECLLHYPAAVAAEAKAIELGLTGKRELKRLAMLRQAREYWERLPLNPDQLPELARFLRENMGDGPFERSFEWTEKWLRDQQIANPEDVIDGFRKLGAYSDLQIYYNVAR